MLFRSDGTVDWYTFSGYRRYHAECHVCHGPNGGGSTYAPALKDSVKRFNYAEFAGIVIGGRQNGNSVMPAFADNKNAVCYIDDLYVYLRALSTGAVQPGDRDTVGMRMSLNVGEPQEPHDREDVLGPLRQQRVVVVLRQRHQPRRKEVGGDVQPHCRRDAPGDARAGARHAGAARQYAARFVAGSGAVAPD